MFSLAGAQSAGQAVPATAGALSLATASTASVAQQLDVAAASTPVQMADATHVSPIQTFIAQTGFSVACCSGVCCSRDTDSAVALSAEASVSDESAETSTDTSVAVESVTVNSESGVVAENITFNAEFVSDARSVGSEAVHVVSATAPAALASHAQATQSPVNAGRALGVVDGTEAAAKIARAGMKNKETVSTAVVIVPVIFNFFN
ncbi:hypothetical protein J3F82_000003 [Coemansia sp. RSA 637]|nr:hypothetical protein J3F82_000003 [Coemansia sp. RSA 637]